MWSTTISSLFTQKWHLLCLSIGLDDAMKQLNNAAQTGSKVYHPQAVCVGDLLILLMLFSLHIRE